MGGFFGFSSTDYRQKVPCYNNIQLKESEVRTYRCLYGATAGMVAGAGLAVATAGMAIPGAAINARRRRVFERKLEIIQECLSRRNIPLYNPQLRDKIIPALGATAGAGITMGLDAGLSSAMAGDGAAYLGSIAVTGYVPCFGDGIYFPADQAVMLPAMCQYPAVYYDPGSGAASSAWGDAARKGAQSMNSNALGNVVNLNFDCNCREEGSSESDATQSGNDNDD